MALNIVYLHCHDAGRYIQPYGRPCPTPALQKLAEEGVLFRQAFTPSPTCSPSRAALLTGRLPHQSGMLGLAHLGFRLNDYRDHLAQILNRAGYHTALSGFQHVACPPVASVQDIGYTEILTEDNTEAAADAAIDFLQRSHEKPFFLDVGLFAPHRPFPCTVPIPDARFVQPPAGLPDTPEIRQDIAQFIASMQSTDVAMGRVIAAIDQLGLSENTLIIATTDHGIPFPRSKCTLYDSGTEVFLILRGPAPFNGGTCIDQMVSHLDIIPTLAEAIGFDHPESLPGRSLLPLLRKETSTLHQSLFGEINFHAGAEPVRSVRTSDWKYIRRYPPFKTVLPNIDDSPAKACLYRAGAFGQSLPKEELYHLESDPQETHNLVRVPDHAPILQDLRSQLHQWMEFSGDPLLTGQQHIPDQAILTKPGAYSPLGEPGNVPPEARR